MDQTDDNKIEEIEIEQMKEIEQIKETEQIKELVKVDNMENRSFFVYCLLSKNKKYTYIGATIDVIHRLRQHNSEIKGGAKATTSKGPGQWDIALYVSGFPFWKTALQFEWRWKQITRKTNISTKSTKCSPITRRIIALQTLLSLNSATSSAIPFSEWKTPPTIHYCTISELEYNRLLSTATTTTNNHYL